MNVRYKSTMVSIHIPHNPDQEVFYHGDMGEDLYDLTERHSKLKSDEITKERQDRARKLLLNHRRRYRDVPGYYNVCKQIAMGKIGERLGHCWVIDNVLKAMERENESK